jgi:hypothetical protein
MHPGSNHRDAADTEVSSELSPERRPKLTGIVLASAITIKIMIAESATGEVGCSEGESPSSLVGVPPEFGTKELNGKV